MIEIYLIYSVLGVVALIGFALLGLVRLPSRAREEAERYVRPAAATILGAMIVGALFWSSTNAYSQKSGAEAALETFCAEAREQIFRTVPNVEGFLVKLPSSEAPLHANDTQPETFLKSPAKPYAFVELSLDPTRTMRSDIASPYTREPVPAPSARYAVTWTELNGIADTNIGLHGDETIVFDMQTREVLARRVTYYHIERGRRLSTREQRLTACPQVKLGTSTSFVDSTARDSYEFVSRVLMPATPSTE